MVWHAEGVTPGLSPGVLRSGGTLMSKNIRRSKSQPKKREIEREFILLFICSIWALNRFWIMPAHFSSDLLDKDFAKNHTPSRSGKIGMFWAFAKF